MRSDINSVPYQAPLDHFGPGGHPSLRASNPLPVRGLVPVPIVRPGAGCTGDCNYSPVTDEAGSESVVIADDAGKSESVGEDNTPSLIPNTSTTPGIQPETPSPRLSASPHSTHPGHYGSYVSGMFPATGQRERCIFISFHFLVSSLSVTRPGARLFSPVGATNSTPSAPPTGYTWHIYSSSPFIPAKLVQPTPPKDTFPNLTKSPTSCFSFAYSLALEP